MPLALAVAVSPAGRAAEHLTGSDLLVRTYRSIIDLDTERTARDLADACGPAPKEACMLLGLAAERWQLELDSQNKSHDAHLLAGAEAAIRATEAWTAREPSRAEAWFYLGASYTVRALMHGLRLERLAAARDGKRIKNALERALALDPGLDDAHFGIGAYKYLAGVVPAPARLLAWLLLLPGGDRVKGLQEMNDARARGVLLADEADYQLHWFYLWYEHQPDKALALLQGLRSRFPRNPIFMWRIAEVQDVHFHDRPASRDTYRELVALAENRRVAATDVALARARLGLADQLNELAESDLAVDALAPLVAAKPAAPYGALARAWYLTGLADDRLGRRDAAVAAYRSAIAAVPADDPDNLRSLARTRLSRAPDSRLAEAYRLSIDGWRALERGALAEATASLTRSIELNPLDPAARYRLGKVYLARGDMAHARAEFDRTIAARPVAPPWFLAAAYVETASIAERDGDRARAAELYRLAAAIGGAEAQTRDAARAGLARVSAKGGSRPPIARNPER